MPGGSNPPRNTVCPAALHLYMALRTVIPYCQLPDEGGIGAKPAIDRQTGFTWNASKVTAQSKRKKAENAFLLHTASNARLSHLGESHDPQHTERKRTIMEIKMNLTKTPKQKPDWNHLGFGKIFTDHMFVMDWDSETGWHDARIEPFGPLVLHPAATVFHYGA